MTTLSFPSLSRPTPASVDWALVGNTQAFASPLSGAVQTLELPSPRWRFAMEFRNLLEPDAALLQAFLVQLRGRSGRFYMHNMARSAPRGVATGTPLVNGAAQTGNTLATDGWPPSTTGILKAGDFFGVNGELKMLVADASSNVSGQATLTFEPPLRASPADNAAITTSQPTATFMLDEDAMRWVTHPPVSGGLGVVSDFTLVATEVWA